MPNSLLAALRPAAATDTPLRRVSEWTGLAGLLIFALFSLFSIAPANLGLALMLVALLISPDAWRRLWREPLFWLSLATVGYIALRAVAASAEFEGIGKTISNQAKDWAWLFLFAIPGWWMSRAPQRILLGLGLMLGGFALGILSSLDSDTLGQLAHGLRSGLHFGKPIIFGFDCAVALLALVSLLHYLLSPAASRRHRRRWLLIALAGFALLLFLQGLVVSQSRGVWLAFLVALPFTLFLLFRGRQPGVPRGRATLAIIAGGVVLVILALALNWNTIKERLAFENRELGIVVSQGLEQAPLGSATYRLHLWRFGIGKWLERPLLGWGPGTTYAQIAAEDSPGLKNPDGSSFDHLHNAYLELLFQLGLVGAALVAAIALLLLRRCLRGFRSGAIAKPLYAFLLGNFVLIAVYSLTDFRHLHWNWRFYWMMLAGAVFALQLLAAPARGETQRDAPRPPSP